MKNWHVMLIGAVFGGLCTSMPYPVPFQIISLSAAILLIGLFCERVDGNIPPRLKTEHIVGSVVVFLIALLAPFAYKWPTEVAPYLVDPVTVQPHNSTETE